MISVLSLENNLPVMSALFKFLHTSDLHLGKRLFGFSLEEDQKHFLNEILSIAEEEQVDAIIIAGDIYDVSQPPEEAIRMFSDFIHRASGICAVYAIAGNHDSADRIGYAKELLAHSNVFVTGRYEGKAVKFPAKNGVNIFMLPYMRTSSARHYYNDPNVRNPDQAVNITLQNSGINADEVNIIVAHQFIAGRGATLTQSDSESARLSVGTDDLIHSDLFDAFDYGAFGHIHKPQLAGRRELQYCGSPMKYSESEYKDVKKVNIVTINGKNDVDIKEVPLHPLREMYVLKGTFREVYNQAKELPKGVQVYVTLTETEDRASEKLSTACETLFHVSYDLPRTASSSIALSESEIEMLSDRELFIRFYKQMHGKEPSSEQMEIIDEIMGAGQ